MVIIQKLFINIFQTHRFRMFHLIIKSPRFKLFVIYNKMKNFKKNTSKLGRDWELKWKALHIWRNRNAEKVTNSCLIISLQFMMMTQSCTLMISMTSLNTSMKMMVNSKTSWICTNKTIIRLEMLMIEFNCKVWIH